MATNTSPSTDPESAHWYDDDQELLGTVKTFHEFYAMSPEKLEKVKKFNEEKVLDKFLEYLGVCSECKKIGGSYEGVKVVKSEEDADFEFDVMFVWKIPDKCPLEIVEIPGRHGYARLQVGNGHMNTAKDHRSANHKFFAECLTFENDTCIVDAGKTISAFFSKLQKWINTRPVSGYKLLPRQHGTAIQVDVIPEQTGDNTATHNKILYSVDIAPTFEIWEGDDAKRYVAKPEKKRTPDSITWLRLFDSEESSSGPVQLARSSWQTAVDELQKQLSEYQGSCAMLEARTRMPLPLDDIEKLQAALVGQVSSYRIPLVNLQDLKKGKSMRIMAIAYFFDKELEVLSVPDKPGYVWLKIREEASVSSCFSDALKLCYLPGGKYLDIKAASDVLVKELREIVKDLFRDQVVIVRRDGPIVCIDVYPEKGNTMLYYGLDIVLKYCIR